MDLSDEDLIDLYLVLRDRRAKRKVNFDDADIVDKQKQIEIEQLLLERIKKTKESEIYVDSGTAYLSNRSVATVKDWDLFIDFVIENKAWALLSTSCSKVAVKEFIDRLGNPPPGIIWLEELSIGVRREN